MNFKKLGLCLSGGGGKGAYQIGVWQALREFGLDHNIGAISGTSVGGLNGVMVAQNKFDQAKSMWLNIESRNMLSIQDVPDLASRLAMLTSSGAISPLLAHFIQTKGLFKQDGLKSMIDEGVDTQLLASSALPLTVALHNTAANRVDYRQVDDPHTAADMLLGTAALPLIFDDVRINGNTYTDGGFYWGLPQKRLDNTPIVPLIESGCDTIVVAYLSPDDLSINPRHYPGVRILPIVPANDLGGLMATLDFSNEGAARRMEQGYHDAAQIFRHLDLFLEKEAQYEALWQRVQLTAEQEHRRDEGLLNVDGQHRRAVRDIHDFERRIAEDDFHQSLEPADDDLPQALDRLSLENTSLLADIERREIETAVENFIVRNANNKRAVETAALDALAALAPVGGRATHLSEQGVLSRLWGAITGKNQRISAENDHALAQAQFAALRLIAAVQGKGAITLEFACTLQNRINGAFAEIERLGERHNRDLRRVYRSMAGVYCKLRDHLNTHETRLGALERSDRLQNWLLHPNRPRLNGKTLGELPPVLRLCCLANDFFRITGANWQVSELNSLREMCINVGLGEKYAVRIADFCEKTSEQSTCRQALTADLAILPNVANPNPMARWLRDLRAGTADTDGALALASWGYDADASLPAWDFLIELLYHLNAGGFTVVGSSDIAQYKAHWLEQLDEIEKLIDDDILPRSFGKELHQLREPIRDFRLKVPLIGKFSVGKSTLLNGWLGHEIQREDLGACTSLATEFHCTEPGQEKLVACWLEDPASGHMRREEQPLSIYPACLDRWQAFGQQPLYIEIHLSSPALARHPDLVLVDTPGLGATNGLHERAIQQYIGEAVSCILCVTRTSQVGIDELAFIDRQRSLGQEFSLLVCQEALSNPSERQSLRQSLAAQAGLDPSIPVPGCSAREGDFSGFQDVLTRLESRKADLFRRSFAAALDHLLKQADQLIRQQLAGDTTADQLQEKKGQIDKELARLEVNFKREQDSLLRDCHGPISRQIVATVSGYLRGRRQAYAQMLLGGQSIGPLLTADARNACQLAIEQHLTPRFQKSCNELESQIDVGAFDGPSLEGNGPSGIETNSNLGGAAAGAAAGAAIGSMIPVIGTVIGGLIGGVLGLFASQSRKESEAEGKAQEAIELVVGCLRNSLPETVGAQASRFLTKIRDTLATRIAAQRENLTRIEQQLAADTERKKQIESRAEQALTRIAKLTEKQAATLTTTSRRENHVA